MNARVIAITMLALLCVAVVVKADGRDAAHEERQTQIDVSGATVRFESQVETDTEHTKFIWGCEFEGQPRIMARYRSKLENSNGNDAEESKTEERLRIRMVGLLEYANVAAVGPALEYEEGDTIVTKTRFDRVAWSDFVCADVLRGNVTVTKCTSSFVDGTTDVTFDMYVASAAFLASPSTLVPPRSLKFDVTINSYSYAAEGDYLALVYRVESGGRTKVGDDDDETVQQDSSEKWGKLATDAKLAFSWAGAAAGTGDVVIPVKHSVLTPRKRCDVSEEEMDEGETASHAQEMCETEHLDESEMDHVGDGSKEDDIIAFSFLSKRATFIHWDPLVGENYSARFPTELALIFAGIVALVALVGVVAGVGAILLVRGKRGRVPPSSTKL